MAKTSAHPGVKPPPPAPQTGRPFVKKTGISLESGANLWKVEFNIEKDESFVFVKA